MPENNDSTGGSGVPDHSQPPVETPSAASLPAATAPPADAPLADAASPWVQAEGVPPVATPTAPPAASVSKGGVGLAALIVGIVAMVFAVIPGLCFVAFIPALVALILGIVALAKKHPHRGRALSGVILGGVALIVAIIVSIVVIVSAAAGVVTSSTNTIAPETKISEAPAQKAEPTKAAEVPAPVPADVAYSGTGDSVLKIALPDGAKSAGVATITHTGSSNFSVWGLDDSMGKKDLLVNQIGAYTGTVLFNNGLSAGITSFGISADGAWTVTLHSLKSLREFSNGAATGVGDDVVVYRGKSGVATISHDGQNNFSIWSYGDNTDLLVNEIGAYNGTVAWSPGPAVIAVNADGNWNIAVK